MAHNTETQKIPARELRTDDRVLASNGKFRQVRVAVPMTDSGDNHKPYILAAYISGGQDRFPVEGTVTIRKRTPASPVQITYSDPDRAGCIEVNIENGAMVGYLWPDGPGWRWELYEADSGSHPFASGVASGIAPAVAQAQVREAVLGRIAGTVF